jgi:hypothetical protein
MCAVESTYFPNTKPEVTRFLESLGACVFWLTPDGIRFLNEASEVTRFRLSGDAWRF